MKLLTKLIIGVESALTTSISALWNATNQSKIVTQWTEVVINHGGYKFGDCVSVYEVERQSIQIISSYPYQPLCIALAIIGVIVAGLFIIKLVKQCT